MPIETTPFIEQFHYATTAITHTNGVEFTVVISSEGVGEADGDEAIQSLVNHLDAWPDIDKVNGTNPGNVRGEKQARDYYQVLVDETSP